MHSFIQLAAMDKVTSTQHTNVPKSDLVADILYEAETIKEVLDSMVENLENGPIFGGPGNSKDELSNALYDIQRV